MDGYFTSQFLEGKRNGVHKNLTVIIVKITCT